MLLATIGTGLGQPNITTQPQPCTNVVGTTATFTVGVTGTEPLAYQWQKQDSFGTVTDLVGCTDSALVLTNVQTSHAADYFVVVTNADGAVTSDLAHLTIVPPPTLRFSTTSYTIAESAGSVSLTVWRLYDTNTPVSVDFATGDFSAKASLDYTATNGTLVFAAGVTNRTLTVSILNDGLVEATEYFRITLSNPTNAVLGAPAGAGVYITDNDVGLQFEFANYWAREDEGSVLIGVVRGDDGNLPFSVDFATSNLTATNGLDYTATNGTLSFAAGEKVKLFTVPLLNDGLKESSETFRVTLSNPTNQVLGSQKLATITITDNDPGVQFTRNEYWVYEDEGAILLTVSRGNDGLLGAFTVDYATSNINAIAGQDYAETHGTLGFAAGEMSKSFTVPVFDEAVAELNERFKVLLSNPTGGMALGMATNRTATVTLCDRTEMAPHRLDNIHVSPEGVVSLTLGGGYTPGVGLVNWSKLGFDIYPLEASTNLVDWVPLKWLVRTSASTKALTFVDSQASGSAPRFYRTPTRAFVAAQRAPTGPYAVGFTDRTLIDDTRRNRYRISTNNSFPITIWYPAERVAGQWPGPYLPGPFVRDLAVWGDTLMSYCCGYSASNAPSAKGLGQLPVVLWSHGWTDVRSDGMEWAEHLASHGYVVVGIDHTDGSMVAYPDGTYLFTDFSDLVGRGLDAQLIQDRVRDFAVVLEVLEGWNQNDSLFAGKLDVQNVAVLGYSLGGAAAGEFCRLDPRCVAAVALDPGGFNATPTLNTLGLQKPSLTMHRPDLTDDILFSKATTNAYWFQVRCIDHGSFGTWYWAVTATDLPAARETARTITDWTLWFLNKYLKGSADPMPQTAAYPQIFNFKQK